MWDEHDYENGRNMCWNLFTSFGESVWLDQQAEPASFDRRFQHSFYAMVSRGGPGVGTLPSRWQQPQSD